MCVNDYHNGEIKFMAITREKAEAKVKELNKKCIDKNVIKQ